MDAEEAYKRVAARIWSPQKEDVSQITPPPAYTLRPIFYLAPTHTYLFQLFFFFFALWAEPKSLIV